MAKISSLPKDMPILNNQLRQLTQLQQQIADLQNQLAAIVQRLKNANIP